MKAELIHHGVPQRLTLTMTAITLSLMSYSKIVQAEVVFDGTVGTPGALTGPDFQINADRGSQVGSNLFHSFSQFNINNTESATFNGPNGINNVISRVTGGSSSTINGGLNVNIPSANFYFINPAGVVVGPDASISVDGTFNVSTASHLELPGGGRFDVINPASDVLTTGDPAAYGFLGNSQQVLIDNATVTGGVTIVSAGIEVRDSTLLGNGGIVKAGELPDGSSFYEGTPVRDVNLISVQGTTTVPSPNREASLSDIAKGSVKITRSSIGNAGGDVRIVGGDVVIDDNSAIGIGTNPVLERSPEIKIEGQNISIDNGSIIETSASFTRNRFLVGGEIVQYDLTDDPTRGGDIYIIASDDLRIDNQSLIGSRSSLSYKIGDTYLSAENFILTNRSQIKSQPVGDVWDQNGRPSGSTESFGNIFINASSVLFENRAELLVRSLQAGGDVEINADTFVNDNSVMRIVNNAYCLIGCAQIPGLTINANSIELRNGGWITLSDDFNPPVDELRRSTEGLGLELELKAEEISFNEGKVAVDYNFGSGEGRVNVEAGTLNMTWGSIIASSIFESESVEHAFTIVANDEINMGNSLILSAVLPDAHSPFNPGFRPDPELDTMNVRIESPSINITDGGRIETLGYVDMEMESDSLYVSGGELVPELRPGSILIREGFWDAAGVKGLNGSNVSVKSNAILLENGGQIAGDPFGAGLGTPEPIEGGSINVNATSIDIVGEYSAIVTTSLAKNGLPININASSIRLNDRGSIASNSLGISGPGLFNAPWVRCQNCIVSGSGGDISVAVDTLFMENSSISTSVDNRVPDGFTGDLFVGDAGTINLNISGTLTASENSQILSEANATSKGGSIEIVGKGIILESGSTLQTSNLDEGDAGNIRLHATDELMLVNSGVSTSSNSGAAGAIELTSDSSLSVKGYQSTITTETQTGRAGSVVLTGKIIDLSGGIISADVNHGYQSGEIRIDGETVSIHGMQLRTTTSGVSNGGNILVSANEALEIAGQNTQLLAETVGSGNGGSIQLEAGQLELNDNVLISANSVGQGNAGTLSLSGDNIYMTDGAVVSTSTAGPGSGGKINVDVTGTVRLSGDGTSILAETSGAGDGGSITVKANAVFIKDGATVSSASSGEGSSGTVTIESSSQINLSGSGTLVSSSSAGAGTGGNVTFLAEDLMMGDGAEVRASNRWTGDAGDIHIKTEDSIRLRDSRVSTEAATGGGGNITLLTTNLLQLNRSTLSASVLGESGSGGNIFIDPHLVLMQNSRVSANAVFGNGGNINIHADILAVDANTVISASSQFGVDGQVFIDALILPLRNSERLPKKTNSKLLRSRCMANREGASSFTIAGNSASSHVSNQGLMVTLSDYMGSPMIDLADPVQVAMHCGSL